METANIASAVASISYDGSVGEISEEIATLHLCTECGQTFPNGSELQEHMVIHDREKPFKCSFCDIKYVHYRSLERHVRDFHSGRPFRLKIGEVIYTNVTENCPEEGFSDDHSTVVPEFVDLSALNSNRNQSKDDGKSRYKYVKNFQCTFCSRIFAQKSHCQEHVRIHTGEQPFLCGYCGHRFGYRSAFYNHVKKVHKEYDVSKGFTSTAFFGDTNNSKDNHIKVLLGDIIRIEKKRSVKRNSPKVHECTECTKTFSCSAHLREHMKRHTGEKPFECDICEMQFRHRNSFKRHMNSFHEVPDKLSPSTKAIKRMQCTVCDKVFTHPWVFFKHKRLHFKGKPYHQCNICQRKFTFENSLRRHVKSLHTEGVARVPKVVKKSQCTFCSKVFRQPCRLREHMKLHSGEKPYECIHCQRKFRYENSCKRHMRTVHRKGLKQRVAKQVSDSNDNRYIGEGIAQEILAVGNGSDAQDNLVAENLDSANTDGKSFVCVESGDNSRMNCKEFKCHLCSKTVSQKHHLQEHMRRHTGEKPFQCDSCYKVFRQRRSLIRHVETVHKKNFARTRASRSSRLINDNNDAQSAVLEESLVDRSISRNLNVGVDSTDEMGNIDGNDNSNRSTLDDAQSTVVEESLGDNSVSRNLNVVLIESTDETGNTADQNNRSDLDKASELEQSKNNDIDKGAKTLQCRYCCITVSQVKHLKEHMKRHTGEKPYKCNFCEMKFRIYDDLRTHLKTVHNHRPVYRPCKITKMFQCKLCNYKVSERRHILKHVRIHTGEKPYECDRCKMQFRHQPTCRRHIRTRHGGYATLKKVKNSSPSKADVEDCFILLVDLVEDRILSEISGTQDFAESGAAFLDGTDNFNNECIGGINGRSVDLTADSSVEANPAGKKYGNSSVSLAANSIESDVVMIDDTESENEKSVNADSRRSVNLSVNSSEELNSKPTVKNHRCEYCGKLMASNHLREHLLTHTGEKPLVCSLCDMRFRQKRSLQRHTSTVHKHNITTDSGKKSRNSSVSVAGNSIESDVAMIDDTENENAVNADSRRSADLSVNSSNKLNSKPTAKICRCEYCGKSMASHHFREHLRIHTGEKPLTCSLCDMRFRHRSTLRRHILTVHKHDSIAVKNGKVLDDRSASNVGNHIESDATLINDDNECASNHSGSLNLSANNDAPLNCTQGQLDVNGKKVISDGGEHCTLQDIRNIVEVEKETNCEEHSASESGILLKSAIRLNSSTLNDDNKCSGSNTRDSVDLSANDCVTPKCISSTKMLRCNFCGENITTDTFMKHLRIHTGEEQMACSQCDLRFRRYASFRRHMLTKHTDKDTTNRNGKNSSVSVAGNSIEPDVAIIDDTENENAVNADSSRCADLSVNSIENVNSKPTAKICRCEYCGKSMASHHFREHLRIHTGEKPLTCSLCDMRFRHRSTLRRHILTVHKHDSIAVKNGKILDDRSASNVGNYIESDATLINDFENDDNECASNHSGSLNLSANNDVPLNCTQGQLDVNCKKVISDGGEHCTLQDIRNIVVVEKETNCEEHSASEGGILLKPTVRLISSALNDDNKCSGSNRDSVDLSANDCVKPKCISSTKMLRCNFCGENITTDTFMKHLRIHTGEESMACSQCDLRFRRYGSFRRHMLTKHTDKDTTNRNGKNSSVSVAGNSIEPDVALIDDTENENAVNDDSGRSVNLSKNGTVEANSEPFVDTTCKYCGKSMALNHLREHSRIHTGEKPLVCSLCEMRFRHRSTLRRHILTVHKNDNINIEVGKSDKGFDLSAYSNVEPKPLRIGKYHSCEYCGKSMASHHLREHLRIHTGEKPFACSLCDMRCRHRSTLRRHTLTVHKYSCTTVGMNDDTLNDENVCTARNDRDSLDLSVNNDVGTNSNSTGRILQCFYCDKSMTQSHLREHLLIHTGEKPLLCSFCDMSFRHTSTLRKHTRTVHKRCYECKMFRKDYDSKSRNTVRRNSKVSDRGSVFGSDLMNGVCRCPVNKYKCPLCEKIHVSSISRNRHIRKAHRGAVVPKWTPGKFLCSICGLLFGSKLLQAHMRMHAGEKAHECKFCQRKFFHSSSLRTHLKARKARGICSSRVGVKAQNEWTCVVCSRLFHSRTHLQVHMRMHTGESPYKCDFCQSRFRFASSIRSHLKSRKLRGTCPKVVVNRINVDSRFQCTVCMKILASQSSLVGHKRIHSGEKPFHCEFCGVRFRYSGTLYRHVRTVHKGCPVRKAVRMSMGSTGDKEQNRAVTIGKGFKCTICNKQTSQKHHLVEHMRLHTGEKPFKCELCEKQFRQYSSALRHIKIMHNQCGNNIIQNTVKNMFTFKSDENINDNSTCNVNHGTPYIGVNAENVPGDNAVEGYRSQEIVVNNGGLNNTYHFGNDIQNHGREIIINGMKTVDNGRDLESTPVVEIADREDLDEVPGVWIQVPSNEHLNLNDSTAGQNRNFDDLLASQVKVTDRRRETGIVKGQGRKLFKCNFCNKTTTQKRHLQEHMFRHTGERPFKCEVCDKCFRQSSAFLRHMKCVHNIGKNSSDLNGDNSAVETSTQDISKNSDQIPKNHKTPAKKYECLFCNRLFSNKIHCHEHMRKHTGEAPLSCGFCHARFRYKSCMLRHQKIRETRGTCPVDRKALTKHLGKKGKTHKRFQCALCGKIISKKCNMKAHMRVHTGERPFKCDYCEMRFRYTNTLYRHMKTLHKGFVIRKVVNFLADVNVEESFKEISATDNAKDYSVVAIIDIVDLDENVQKPVTAGTMDQRAVETIVTFDENNQALTVTSGPGHLKGNINDTLNLNHGGDEQHMDATSTSDGALTRPAQITTATGRPRKPVVRHKKYQCGFCSKIFTNVCHYRDHLRMHTGDRPFECTFCHANFRQRNNLKKHLANRELRGVCPRTNKTRDVK